MNLINNIFIFGSTGYIGKELQAELSKRFSNILSVGRGLNSDLILNLQNPNIEKLDMIKSGDIFIFLAGISSPEACAQNYDKALLINYKNTSLVISALLEKGVNVLFASSDVVYGEASSPVNELSPTESECDYAGLKIKVENRFLKNENFNVMRLSYVWSFEDKFTKYVISEYKKNNSIEVYHPLLRSVISLRDVIDFVDAYIHRPKSIPKIVNLAGPECLSRVDLIKILSTRLDNLSYEEVLPHENFYKYRPKIINMQSNYLESILQRKPIRIIDFMDCNV